MKTKTLIVIGIVLIIVATLLALAPRSKAQSQERKTRIVVYITARETYHMVEEGGQSYSVPNGLVVEYSSGSSNGPTIPVGISIGEAIAQALSFAPGMHLESQPVWGAYLITN